MVEHTEMTIQRHFIEKKIAKKDAAVIFLNICTTDLTVLSRSLPLRAALLRCFSQLVFPITAAVPIGAAPTTELKETHLRAMILTTCVPVAITGISCNTKNTGSW